MQERCLVTREFEVDIRKFLSEVVQQFLHALLQVFHAGIGLLDDRHGHTHASVVSHQTIPAGRPFLQSTDVLQLYQPSFVIDVDICYILFGKQL